MSQMALLVAKKGKNPLNRDKIFFLQVDQYEYQKIQNYTLVFRKMSTYQSDNQQKSQKKPGFLGAFCHKVIGYF
jgi:hypothetical protein